MAEDWNFYLCRVDDHLASIFLDLGAGEEAPIKRFGELGYMHVFMRQPRPDGLSSNEEFETLSAIDDALTEALAGKGRRYVGRMTTDGRRTFYFYCNDGSAFEKQAVTAMHGFPDYEFETGYRVDSDWSIYRDFLYPGVDDMQRIRNRDVIEVLHGHGDKPQLPRLIDHWAYFPSQQAATSYTQWLQSQEFTIEDAGRAENGEHLVRFARVDQPLEIDDVVLPLNSRANELGGNYDGWECQVIQSDE